MSKYTLTFEDHINLRDALKGCEGGAYGPVRTNGRTGEMLGRQWRSWKKLQRLRLGDIEPSGGEAECFVLTDAGKIVALEAHRTGAVRDALDREHRAQKDRHANQQLRRGRRIFTIGGIETLATEKRSVLFADWNVGARPAAMVLQMQVSFVLKHLRAGIYLYVPPKKKEKAS